VQDRRERFHARVRKQVSLLGEPRIWVFQAARTDEGKIEQWKSIAKPSPAIFRLIKRSIEKASVEGQ
jgi:hypothetical protein